MPYINYEGWRKLLENKPELKQIPIKPMPTIEPLEDTVNHPSHYTTGKVEVIDYIVDKLTKEQFEGYCIGNVIKYVSRYRHKGGMNDLKKAKWHLNKLEEQHEKA